MIISKIHEDDQQPYVHYENGDEFFIRVHWATNADALTNPGGRNWYNYHLSPERFVINASSYSPVLLGVDPIWWQTIKYTTRTLYCYVEARLVSGSWQAIDTFLFIVNHDPVANAGSHQQIILNAGQVPHDVILDGSGSYDIDANDPILPDDAGLNFSWELENAPAGIDTAGVVYNTAIAIDSIATPLFLPRNSHIPATDEGVFNFSLKISDNDVAQYGARAGRAGEHTSSTTVVLHSPPPNLTILSPTTVNPATLLSQIGFAGGGLRISYSIGAGMAAGPTLGGAWMLRLSIIQARNWQLSVNPAPVGTTVFELTRVGPQLNDNIFWNGIMTNANPAINGRPAEGVFDIRIELLDRGGVQTADPATIVSENTSIFIYATQSQQRSAQILLTPGIQLANGHLSGVPDNAHPLRNIQDVAGGTAASRSAYGPATDPSCPGPVGAPGGTIDLDPTMLQALIDAAATWNFAVREIAGGCHNDGSRHYNGLAVDIHLINGATANAANAQSGPFAAFLIARSARVLGPVAPAIVDGNHNNHLHAQW